jgi:glutaredoxin
MQTPMFPSALVLYGRLGCHLCDDMKEIVVPLARELGCTLQEIDISGHPDLEAQYGTEIPVLLINGRKAFKYRLSERELRQRLAREGRARIRHRGGIRSYADHRG